MASSTSTVIWSAASASHSSRQVLRARHVTAVKRCRKLSQKSSASGPLSLPHTGHPQTQYFATPHQTRANSVYPLLASLAIANPEQAQNIHPNVLAAQARNRDRRHRTRRTQCPH